MDFIINHNYPKDKALTMVKKAISGKFAIIKDGGFTLKAGAPTAPATIEVDDGKVTVSGGILSKMFVDGIGNEIKMYFEEKQEEANTNAPTNASTAQNTNAVATPNANAGATPSVEYTLQDYFDYQERAIKIIKSYKDLLDNNIITENEFNEKKAEILNFIKGIM